MSSTTNAVLLALVLGVGCGKSAPSVALDWRPVGTLGIEAQIAANDVVTEVTKGQTMKITVADRSGRRGAGSHDVYVQLRDGSHVVDSLEAAKTKEQEDLDRGREKPAPAEWPVATQTADGWHLEWKETGTATPTMGVSIGATIGGKKVVCTSFAMKSDDLQGLVAVCESLRAKP